MKVSYLTIRANYPLRNPNKQTFASKEAKLIQFCSERVHNSFHRILRCNLTRELYDLQLNLTSKLKQICRLSYIIYAHSAHLAKVVLLTRRPQSAAAIHAVWMSGRSAEYLWRGAERKAGGAAHITGTKHAPEIIISRR